MEYTQVVKRDKEAGSHTIMILEEPQPTPSITPKSIYSRTQKITKPSPTRLRCEAEKALI